jgi:thioredoxin reductase
VRLRARAVIVATGTRGIIPDDIPVPLSLLGSYIYREIADVTPRLVERPPDGAGPMAALIGGGDCAFDYGLNLLGRGCRVTILHRGQRPRALPVLVDRVARSGAAEYRPGVTVGGIERVERGLRLHLKGGNGSTLEVDFLMLAVGREPEDAILAPGLRAALDAGERIDGLHLAGDVRRGYMRQVGIAVGDGLVAAMETAGLLKGRQR